VAVGHVALADGPLYLSLQDAAAGAPLSPQEVASAFDAAATSRREVATRVVVDTPDPFVNAAAPALCIAADAVWDEAQGVVMHGAVAWRNRLLGWRGPYALDDLGWHDRMTRHLTYWAGQQITSAQIPTAAHADPKKNLATDDWAMLHSPGAMSKSHYDMNLAYVDYYLRHALWTGDVAFLKQTWPVLQRHFAWEQRCFRRPYTAAGETLPLYEAYCAIWASDNLQYGGGGAAHGSALNYYHNALAARIAEVIGEDPAPYRAEAAAILKGMRRELWLPRDGTFAEFKDLVPPQTVHPSPAVWTYYHAVDSATASPFDAYQMSRWVDTHIAHFPIRGPGVPADGGAVVASTNWMPYTWSINNVVLAENAATALAHWQAGRPDAAFALFKGNVLDSMFMGLCPGNTHMASALDAYRGESQRDFADPTATLTRALVEGLFGVKPDLLTAGPGTITWEPGFPAAWDHASLKHPDFTAAFRRAAGVDTYTFSPTFAKPAALRLVIPARADKLAAVTVNGRPAAWKQLDDAVGAPRVVVEAPPPAGQAWEVQLTWTGGPLKAIDAPAVAQPGTPVRLTFDGAAVTEFRDPQGVIVHNARTNGGPPAFVDEYADAPGPHTFFARVKQGDFAWWAPVNVDVRPPFELFSAEAQPADGVRFVVRNNTPRPLRDTATVGGITLTLNAAPAGGLTDALDLPSAALRLLPGTNRISLQLAGGGRIDGAVTNWTLKTGVYTGADPLDLSPAWNAKVANIFKAEYLSPRSPYVSLSIPKQGVGGWSANTTNPTIDDAGLRQAAGDGGLFPTSLGVPFKTAGEGKNVAFVSWWDNHPKEVAVPLSGTARHAYFLMAGSTNPMRSRMKNGEVVVTYADGSAATLLLENPTTWWPIEQDYLIDDFAFSMRPGGAGKVSGAAALPPPPLPPRVDLRTGTVRVLSYGGRTVTGTAGGAVDGGAAVILDLPLDQKPLKSLTLRASTNEVIIGLMGVTLVR
jgi:hypothetical protein